MFKEKAEKSVVDAGVIMTPVYQVQCSEPAIEAFRVMDNRKLSCICVVSPDGAIAGCFTSRGLKEFVKKPRRSSLLLPMCEFLAEVSKPTEPVVVCRKEDTVVTVMKLMAEKNVHRVYVVDEANKPVGIIALTDIMKYIAK